MREMCVKVLMVNLQGKDYFVDLGTEGKILKLMDLKGMWQVYGLDSSTSGHNPVAVYCGQ
jgi:hypothetical protein